MSIHIELDPSGTQATITFRLTEDPDVPVSVVGSFNDWNPASNPLLPGEKGTRSTSVTLDAAHDVHFRYLGSGGDWFDNADADEITAEGSVIHLPQHVLTPEPGTGAATRPPDPDPDPAEPDAAR